MKIAVCVPSHDSVPMLFAYDLASLCAFTAAVMPEDCNLGINTVTGTYVHSARHQLMVEALRQKADYVLWIDSDMRFPRDALVRLLQHQVPMVGINYAKRGVPSGFVAIKEVGEPGVRLRTMEDSTGLEEAEAIGFGLVLMKTSSLGNMPDPMETPWFENIHLGKGLWMGEDVTFCKLYRESGQRVFVDHDLSKACGHMGLFEYQLAHAQAEEPLEAEAV